jgi:hypothetical protein
LIWEESEMPTAGVQVGVEVKVVIVVGEEISGGVGREYGGHSDREVG